MPAYDDLLAEYLRLNPQRSGQPVSFTDAELALASLIDRKTAKEKSATRQKIEAALRRLKERNAAAGEKDTVRIIQIPRGYAEGVGPARSAGSKSVLERFE